jgi:uncharacterized membrane protein YkgB
MKLTDAHIQELYDFTEKQKVKHFDLQTELVDHLANGIETQWKEQSTLSFEEILALEFEKFGAKGFKNVIDKHDGILRDKYKKLLYRFGLEYFKLPKIIGTITAIILVMYLQRFGHFAGWAPFFYLCMLIPYMFLSTIQLRWQYRRKVKQTNRRWKLEEMIFGTSEGITLVIIILNIVFSFDLYKVASIYVQFLSAFMMVASLILTYIIFIILPDKAAELLRETYPEYELLA